MSNSRFFQKPRHVFGLSNHHLARDLVFCSILNESHGYPRDLCTKTFANVLTASWTYDDKSGSPVIQSQEEATSVAWPANSRWDFVHDKTAFSLFVAVNIEAFSGIGINGTLMGKRTTVVDGVWDFFLNNNESGENVAFFHSAPNTTVSWAGAHPGLGYHTFGLTRLEGNDGTWELWIDGLSQGIQTNATTVPTAGPFPMRFGELGTNDDDALPGQYHAGAMWMARALKDADFKQLHRDYRVLVRSESVLFPVADVPAAAAPEGAGIAASMIGIHTGIARGI